MANIENWMTKRFFRMWPRALFHVKNGKQIIQSELSNPGVYVLYQDDKPFYIGKTGKPLSKRLSQHALKPNARRYNFWNYFSAFEIDSDEGRDEIEAILISAMPTANGAKPRFPKKRIGREAARILNDIQSMMLTGRKDQSGETNPETVTDDEA